MLEENNVLYLYEPNWKSKLLIITTHNNKCYFRFSGEGGSLWFYNGVASISIYSILSFSKLNQDNTLERSFFDLYSYIYLMPQEKPPKITKNH